MAIRVYQIAKEYSTSSDEVLSILEEAGCPVSTHTAELDQHAVLTIRAKLGKFRLTVVDGEQVQTVEQRATEPRETVKPRKTKKKKKAKESPAISSPPPMAVRVIKTQHDEEQEAGETADEKAAVEAKPEEDAAPKAPPRPKLRAPASRMRNLNVKQRLQQIHRIAEQRSEQPAQAPGADPRSPARSDDSRPGSRRPSDRGGRPSAGRPSGGRPPAGRPSDRPKVPGKGTVITAADLNRAFASQGQGPTGDKSAGRGAPGRNFRGGPAHSLLGKKKKKKKRRSERSDKTGPTLPTASKVNLPDEELGIVMLSEGVTVKELAEKINRLSKDVIKRLFERGMMATINDVLDRDLAVELAKDFGYLADVVSFEEDMQIREEEELGTQQEGAAEDEAMVDRAPIVTIMGHVDHGKTSLLDRIRSTKVASGEAGGITQHIGAYSVTCHDRDIVFLDTPGHEAFTKMRARGTSITDLVILVVAADDGVKPQTVEAIHHAQAAKVPIIIAINKIDKPEANPDRVKTMLTEHSLVVEDFGGDSPCVMVSAKTGDGIQELLEMILLVADLANLKANPARKGKGTVVEAQLDRGRGAVATILVQDGTVSVGDFFITGATHGKIRAMNDDEGKAVKTVGPATPVEVLGLQEVPQAGDPFQVVADEATARQISSFRKEKQREEQLRQRKHMSLDQLFNKMTHGEVKELPLIVKADVSGSVEGIAHALEQIVSDKVHLRVLHQGVGNITENDVLLAMASDAIIIGFHVKVEPKAADLAEREQIDVRLYDVIYEISKEIEEAMIGLLAAEYHEKVIGHAVVRQVFQVPRMGLVAGSFVNDGVVKRDSKVRVMRAGEQIHEGEIINLKRFKDDVAEVKSGYECGIKVSQFDTVQEGDEFVIYVLEAVQPTKL